MNALPKEDRWQHGIICGERKFSMRQAITKETRSWLKVRFAVQSVIDESVIITVRWDVITEFHEFLRGKHD